MCTTTIPPNLILFICSLTFQKPDQRHKESNLLLIIDIILNLPHITEVAMCKHCTDILKPYFELKIFGPLWLGSKLLVAMQMCGGALIVAQK